MWSFREQSVAAMIVRARLYILGTVLACILASGGLLVFCFAGAMPGSAAEKIAFSLLLPALALTLRVGSYWIIPPIVVVDRRKGFGISVGKHYRWVPWPEVDSAIASSDLEARQRLRIVTRSGTVSVGVPDSISLLGVCDLLEDVLVERFKTEDLH